MRFRQRLAISLALMITVTAVAPGRLLATVPEDRRSSNRRAFCVRPSR